MFEGCNYLNYNLIKQVQHSLDQANFYRGPGAVVEEEPYHTPSIHELKQKFNTVPTRGQHGKSFNYVIILDPIRQWLVKLRDRIRFLYKSVTCHVYMPDNLHKL